jgi:hypothetical protein
MFLTFKHIKNYTYLILACCSGMHLTKAMEQPTDLVTLPTEAKVHIISFLVSAGNVQEAIKNIKALSLTSKYFNNFINDPHVLDSLIKGISKHFDKPFVETAIVLSTPNALKWLKDYLQQHPQEKELVNKHLLEAIEKDNKNLIEFTLHAGADVNQADTNGNPPLSFAVQQGHKDIVELLLEHGADVNGTDRNNYTSLHWAVIYDHIEIAMLLLQYGATVNQADIHHYTPLHMAASKGYSNIIELLLKAGADVNQVNMFGDTPSRTADRYNHKSITEILLKYGATAPF